MLDFAVNVRASEPPSWLVNRLAARLSDLGRYPNATDERRAVHAVAARHGRSVDAMGRPHRLAEDRALQAQQQRAEADEQRPVVTEVEGRPVAQLAGRGQPSVDVES